MLTFWVDDLAVLLWGREYDEPGLAEDPGSGDDDGVAAVLSVLAVIGIWRLAVKGKGAAALRLAAWLALIIVVLVLISFKDPAVAGALVTGWLGGISAAATGLAHFLGAVLPG